MAGVLAVARHFAACRILFMQHILGMAGQIASGLPLVVITALIARTQGLAQAGRFTVLVGLSAAVFSTLFWEIRSYSVINGFHRFTPVDYTAARVCGLLIATTLTFVVATLMSIPLTLTFVVVLTRCSDGALDLLFGLNILRLETSGALRAYARQHIVRLVMLCVVGGVSMIVSPGHAASIIAVTCVVVFLLVILVFVGSVSGLKSGRPGLKRVRELFIEARWFALATFGSVIMNTAPRISAAWLYSGDSLGVVGISLSMIGLLGIAFFTTWIRYMPRFKTVSDHTGTAWNYIFETVGILFAACLLAYLILPQLTALIFGISDFQQLHLLRRVLISGAVFFGGMALTNLYKATSVPWMEFASYVIALLVAVVGAASVPVLRDMPALLLLAGFVLAIMALFSLPQFRKSAESRLRVSTRVDS